jgi:phytanoyl-CoA hydroxylase
MLTKEQREFFDQNGYVVVPALFNRAEVEFYLDYYTELRNHEQCRRDTNIVNGASGDPLLQYPRLMQMHRWDNTTLNWLLDPRINQCMVDLLDREPLAVQTMFYFKPPHARGQALHQDNYYLRVQPGTCIAAWMALDACEIATAVCKWCPVATLGPRSVPPRQTPRRASPT